MPQSENGILNDCGSLKTLKQKDYQVGAYYLLISEILNIKKKKKVLMNFIFSQRGADMKYIKQSICYKA